jgi:hypothetical protein
MSDSNTQTFDALQNLEQGEFQELGDELLPWLFPELRYLKPHGLSREGKTRRGVPDSYVGPSPREATIAVEYTTQQVGTAGKFEGDYASVRDKCPQANAIFLCTNRALSNEETAGLRATARDQHIRLEIVEGVRMAGALAGDRQDLRYRHLKIPIGAHTLSSLLPRLAEHISVASRGRSASVERGRFLPRFRVDVLCFERIRRAPTGTTLLLGDAGEGKSSWSIDYARRFSVVQPTVWLHALDLSDRSLDPLGDAVALAAYGAADPARIPELALLLRREKQHLLIFLDGADETRDYSRLERTLRTFRGSALGNSTHVVLCCRTEASRQLQEALTALVPDIASKQATVRVGPLRSDERKKLLTILGASHIAQRSIENHLSQEQQDNPLFLEMALALERAGVLDRTGVDLMASAASHFIADICDRLRENGREPAATQIERFLISLAEHLAETGSAGVDEERARELAGETATGENTIVARALQTPLLSCTASGISFGHSLFLKHFAERGLFARPDKIAAAGAAPYRATWVARRAPITPETTQALIALARAHPAAACILMARGVNDASIADAAYGAIEVLLRSRFPSDVRRGLKFLRGIRSSRSQESAVRWFNQLDRHGRSVWALSAADLFFSLEVPAAAHLATLAYPFRITWFEPSAVRTVDGLSPVFREALRTHGRGQLESGTAQTRDACINMLALLRDEKLIEFLAADLERAPLDEGAHHALVFLNTQPAIELYARSIKKTLEAFELARAEGAPEDRLHHLWSAIVPHTTDLIMLPHDRLLELVKGLLASENLSETAVGLEWAELLGESSLFAECALAVRRFPNTMMAVTTNLAPLLASASVEQIRAIFESSDPKVRRALVHSAGEIPRPGLEAFLVERLADAEFRLSAIQSLRRIGAVSAAPQITPFLEDSDPRIREMAARTLGILRYVPAAPRLSQMLTPSCSSDEEYVLVEALGSLGTTDALAALERHYPSSRRRADVLAAVLRLGLDSGVCAAERLTEDRAQWPLLITALSHMGGRSRLGNALDGSGVPRQAHESPVLIRSGALLQRVIHVARERLQQPVPFTDDTLIAVASFELPEATAFLREVAARPLLPPEALRVHETPFLKDPSLEARGLLVKRGDPEYALDLLRIDFERILTARYISEHEIERLSRYSRTLVRRIAHEFLAQRAHLSKTLLILSRFLEPEDRPVLEELEQSEDLAVADEAHRAVASLAWRTPART